MIDTKKCSCCGEEKSIEDFYIQKEGYLGRRADCKICSRKIVIEWHKKHPEYNKNYIKNNPEKRKKYTKKYYENNKEEKQIYGRNYYKLNKEKSLEYGRNYFSNHKTELSKYGRLWREKNKEKWRAYARNRYKKNLELSAIKWMRNFLYRTEQQGHRRIRFNTVTEFGYTPQELILRIECQFKEGMSWNNRREWHIDHKKPISAFKNNTSPKIINMLCNLKPIWKKENLSKGIKY